jgi:hypothetical protein
MTVKNAKDFIIRIQKDNSLRSKLNKTSSSAEISEILSTENLSFSEENYIEASSYLLANSQSLEETQNLQDLFQWWNMINS